MNTRARIATVCQALHFYPTVEENRSSVLETLELAMAFKPDLVCLPENFTTVSHPGSAAAKAQLLSGETIEKVSAAARKHGAYVICPLLIDRDGEISNSAVIIDRRGEIAGIYAKRRPVTSSIDYTVMEHGVAPGENDGVFDLDFGRIGIRICFDVGFPEDWELLARQGARAVFWPSAYDGGPRINAYANICQYYVITSVRTHRSRIIDPMGTTVAATDSLVNVAVRDINLDYAVCHYDFNNGVPDRILSDYAGRVSIASDPDSVAFLVEPSDPSVTIAQLQRQYGFEGASLYHDRHRTAYAAVERGDRPPAQRAGHGERPMWRKA